MKTEKPSLHSPCQSRCGKTLEQRLYDFLRNGDDKMIQPEEWKVRLNMELGQPEHEYLAHEIAAWLRRNRLCRKR